jgi:hypothetical protein
VPDETPAGWSPGTAGWGMKRVKSGGKIRKSGQKSY